MFRQKYLGIHYELLQKSGNKWNDNYSPSDNGRRQESPVAGSAYTSALTSEYNGLEKAVSGDGCLKVLPTECF